MAVGVRSTAAAVWQSGTDSDLTVTTPSGTASGDLLLAFQHVSLNTTAPGTFADEMTAPAGWSQLGSTHSLTNSGIVKVWRKDAGGSEGSSYAFAGPNGVSQMNGHSVVIYCITGHHATTPINVGPTFASSATAATSIPAPSVTTTVNDCLLVCSFSVSTFNNSTTWTNPTGMTAGPSGQASWFYHGYHSASLVLGAAGATGTKTATSSHSSPYLTVSVGVAPAAGGSVNGTAAADLGAGTASAVGVRTVASVAAGAFGALTAAAVGSPERNGAAAGPLGALTGSATGQGERVGAADGALGAVTAVTAGVRTTAGAAGVALGGLSGTATADGTIHGTAALGFGALTAHASGVRTVNAEGSAMLGALLGQGAAVRTVTAQATATFGALTGVVTGTRDATGAAVANLGALTAVAVGDATSTVLAAAVAELGGIVALVTTGFPALRSPLGARITSRSAGTAVYPPDRGTRMLVRARTLKE